ncbi:LysM peptidoglycan-binding domain-containing M23 family metallopeptidase [Planktotalea sp.]|uniref:LysM peptidoglycan-binding domain-containing M23 family metallopeptidase n=1 Tax=Planktotalea sp. TaxID=2029877 RepID=UPI0025F140CB|nr:LysM peptidoglycan-binding domain-containing M23 family metallopeptidase [Planktotalea sp.]
MTIFARKSPLRDVMYGTALLTLSACADGFDLDLRGSTGNKFDTTIAAINATQDRPRPDERGVITYPNYQIAVAQRGDTVSSVAARIGTDATDLARYNGLSPETALRKDEVLAVRKPVSTLPGGPQTGVATAPSTVDITALAQGAIDSTPVSATALPAAKPTEAEPMRHQVARGETAFTIARLYNVSVRSLADWNGLGKDLAVREGQFLLIPVAQDQQADPDTPLAATTNPGAGSPTPTPPSAMTPLPEEKTEAAASPVAASTAPVLAKPTKNASQGRMAFPVQGPIIREYAKGKNDGIGIGASAGTSVNAAAAGTVAAITENTNNLPIIVVKHSNNLLTVYANVDGLKVKKGDTVSRGQQLASVRSGSSDFLHFEVREGFDSVDPLPYLQ